MMQGRLVLVLMGVLMALPVSAQDAPLRGDGHRALQAAVRAGDIEAATTALESIYRASNNAGARAEALLEAARLAARSGDMALAHAYLDWGYEEADGEDGYATKHRLAEEGIVLAANAGDRQGAINRARRYAEAGGPFLDLGHSGRAIRFEGRDLTCPDLAGWHYVRRSADLQNASVGPISVANCHYHPTSVEALIIELSVTERIDPATRRERLLAVTEATVPDSGADDPQTDRALRSLESHVDRFGDRRDASWWAFTRWGRMHEDIGFVDTLLIAERGERRLMIRARFSDPWIEAAIMHQELQGLYEDFALVSR
jgi:hypothetical protein